MKGKLFKTDNSWYVEYKDERWKPPYQALEGSDITEYNTLPLHPDDAKELDKGFTSKFQVEVEFIEYPECPHYEGTHFGKDCSCKTGFIQYAKLIMPKSKKRETLAEEITHSTKHSGYSVHIPEDAKITPKQKPF